MRTNTLCLFFGDPLNFICSLPILVELWTNAPMIRRMRLLVTRRATHRIHSRISVPSASRSASPWRTFAPHCWLSSIAGSLPQPSNFPSIKVPAAPGERDLARPRRTKRFHLCLSAAVLVTCCARPAFSQAALAAAGDYETPGSVNAGDFLPKSAFTGKRLFVEKTARNNGLQNTYRIRAGAGEYEITGNEAALQELRAINQWRQISTTQAISRGVSQSAKVTYDTGRRIVRDPLGTAKKVPQGASRFFGKVKDFVSQDDDDTGQKASVGETIRGVLGVDEEKRKLAARLGVDVYSRNQALQKELDRVATAMAGGGLALNIGTMPIGGAVGIGLTAIGIDQAVDSLINESSPDDLRKWNEQNLAESGAKPDIIAQFFNHPWYSPRQETIITAALKKTGVDPNLFLESANKAPTAAEVLCESNS